MTWKPPPLVMSELVLGDMPGDRIEIGESHIARASVAFPVVKRRLEEVGAGRLLVSLYGGSGVGKSEIGSILAYYCADAGYPAYLMSGDNYSRRCPPHNDAERLNLFRAAGLAAIARDEAFMDEWDLEIHAKWETMADADPALATDHPGYARYQAAGRAALRAYLGTRAEIDFDLVNWIIGSFKAGVTSIPLKRMGRTQADVHFELVDFSRIRVLIIEWTHGNNPLLDGVDLPIFLYSSPEETLAHRRSRGRDADTDSPFTRLVLEIEQSLVNARAHEAALILAGDGALIPPESLGSVLER